MGGTGSYLMDILAKTNVKELHLFDEDVLKQHNAFRMCGAARIEELGGSCSKIDWYRRTYSVIREEGIHVHNGELTGDCRDILARFTTVFIAVDDLTVRRDLQAACNELGIYHVSVGIGVEVEGESNDQLGGNVKVETAFRPRHPRPSELPPEEIPDQAYGIVQTAELNMLGAALAVLEWKAKVGIYRNDRPQGHGYRTRLGLYRPTSPRPERGLPRLKTRTWTAVWVDDMPPSLEPGNLYISVKHRLTEHLCACGCGTEVSLPLGPSRMAHRVRWRVCQHASVHRQLAIAVQEPLPHREGPYALGSPLDRE